MLKLDGTTASNNYSDLISTGSFVKGRGNMLLKELLTRQKTNNSIAIKQGDAELTYADWYLQSMQAAKKIDSLISDITQNIVIFLPNCIK